MKRCYKCGKKKDDDRILCEKCEKELNERMEKGEGVRNEKRNQGRTEREKVD
jgi:uncharacterized membrane protein YvbJ